MAGVPTRVVTAYYAERFGERTLSANDRDAMADGLRRLEAALA